MVGGIIGITDNYSRSAGNLTTPSSSVGLAGTPWFLLNGEVAQ